MPTSANDAKREDFLRMVHNAVRLKLHGTQSREDDAILFMANTLFSLKTQVRHLQGGDYKPNVKDEAYYLSLSEAAKLTN